MEIRFKHLSTVQFLIEKHKLSLSSQDITMLKSTIREVLFTKAQAASEKENALKLLVCMQSSYKNEIDDLASEVLQNEEMVCCYIDSGFDLFAERGNAKTIAFSLLMLKLAMQQECAIELMLQLADFANAKSSELIDLLNNIHNLFSHVDIQYIQTETLAALLQFCLSMSSHEERIVRCQTVQNLAYFCHSDNLKELVLTVLSEMMQRDHPEVRAAILRKLKKLDIKSPKVDYIFQQGQVDNSWSIRRIAESGLA